MFVPSCLQIGRCPCWRAPGALMLIVLMHLAACRRPESLPVDTAVTRHGNDAVASGSTLDLRDSTTGDVMLVGQELRFSGAAGGDYLGAGGRQIIGGRIHGALRAAGGTIRLLGSVDRNATIAGGTVEINRAGVIGRNGYLTGGTVHIDGTIRGTLLVSGGTVVLNGPISGDVEVAAGELFVGPGAAITGSLRYHVPSGKMHMDPYAHVTGAVTGFPVETNRGAAYVFGMLWTLGFLAVGGVLVSLLPRMTSDVAKLVRERSGRSAIVGLCGIILTPFAILLMACTVIGLPLAFLTTLVYIFLLYVSRIAIAVWLGRWVLGDRARLGRSGTLVSFGLGALILMVTHFIPVVGSLVTCIAVIVGLGAIMLRVRALYATPLGALT